MAILTKQAILQAPDLQLEEVAVPEWGGSVLVRGLTGTERDSFEASVITREGKRVEMDLTNMRAKLVVRCVVDENGDRLFSDADAVVLGSRSAVALNRVFEVAQRLSGLTEADMDDLKKVSTGVQNGGSISD